MAQEKKQIQIFKYNKAEKRNKNFMYMDFRRANCYNCDFSSSNFSYASFRGAHFKSCDFFECKFDSTEFIGSNLKKSKFKKAKFKNVIFEGVNLDGTDFSGATFENVIFVNTPLDKASNIKFKEEEVEIYETMPKFSINPKLKEAALKSLENKYIKSSRVLDTKEGNLNTLSLIRLLKKHKEDSLIKGLILSSERIDRDFCTLSYIDKNLNKLKDLGLL